MSRTILALAMRCNPVIYTFHWKPGTQFAHAGKRGRAPFPEECLLNRAAARLLSAFAALSLATLPLDAQTPPQPLTVEAIFAHGPLIGHPPEELAWPPDGRLLTYLEDGELMSLDPGTGKQSVLVSQAKLASLLGNASETDRDHRERYKMASYLWAPDSAHLLFDLNGRLWLYDLNKGTGVVIVNTGAASGDDPKFSPDGEFLSFMREHGLSVAQAEGARHACHRGSSRAQPGYPQRRGGLGLRRRAGYTKQLLLVAGLQPPGLSADG